MPQIILFHERNHWFELFLLKIFITDCTQRIAIVFNVQTSQPSVTPDVLAPVRAIFALVIHAYKIVLNDIKRLVLTAKNFSLRLLPVKIQVYTDDVTRLFFHHPHKRIKMNLASETRLQFYVKAEICFYLLEASRCIRISCIWQLTVQINGL